MTVGPRNFYTASHVGQLRRVTHNQIVVFLRPRGCETLGYLNKNDVFSVVGYDWHDDELQVLCRLGMGWVGPSSLHTSEKIASTE